MKYCLKILVLGSVIISMNAEATDHQTQELENTIKALISRIKTTTTAQVEIKKPSFEGLNQSIEY